MSLVKWVDQEDVALHIIVGEKVESCFGPGEYGIWIGRRKHEIFDEREIWNVLRWDLKLLFEEWLKKSFSLEREWVSVSFLLLL